MEILSSYFSCVDLSKLIVFLLFKVDPHHIFTERILPFPLSEIVQSDSSEKANQLQFFAYINFLYSPIIVSPRPIVSASH